MIELLLLLFLSPIALSTPIGVAWVYKPESPFARRLSILSVIGLFLSLLVTIYLLFYVPEGRIVFPWLPEFNINFVFIFDYLSKYMGVLTAFIAFIIGIYGLEYMAKDYRLGWYWFFYNLFTASMLLVVYSDNLLLLFIGWEGLGLASWGLIGHKFRDDEELSYVGVMKRKLKGLNMFWSPSFGGWRAISTIRVGDMPMLFAIAAIYTLSGTLDLSQIQWGEIFHTIGYAGTVILLICFLAGPLTKSAQIPSSEWLMTAMTGPTTVSALLHSATMVAAGTYVFMRLSWYMEPWNLHIPGMETVYIFMLFIGLISALYGATVALGCNERKVLLAASTMSSLGLMFAIAASSFWFGKVAILIAFWYLIVHAFAKATLFLVAGHLIHVTETRFCLGDLELAKKHKAGFLVTIFATLSLSGIPPFAAYWIKSAMDGVLHHLEPHLGLLPLGLLILVSIIYSAFLAKFLSLNFIKGEKPPHLHISGGYIMASAYTVLVSILAVLLYLILGHVEPVASEFMKDGLLYSSLAVGFAVLLSYSIAVAVPRVHFLSKVGVFLSDRMYLPFLNDLLVPKMGWGATKLAESTNDTIDSSFHRAIPEFFVVSSHKVRKIQSGYLRSYIKIVVGVVMLLLISAAILWK